MINLTQRDLLIIYLWIGDHLEFVLGIASIIITIVLTNLTKSEDKKTTRKIAIMITAIAILFSVAGVYFNSQYTIVPDVYAKTYDAALQSIIDNNLNAKVVFGSTNDISAPTTRVKWQSEQAGTIVSKNSVVLLLLDDRFAVEYTPIFYETESTFKKHTWIWTVNETDKSFCKELNVFLFSDIPEDHQYTDLGAGSYTGSYNISGDLMFSDNSALSMLLIDAQFVLTSINRYKKLNLNDNIQENAIYSFEKLCLEETTSSNDKDVPLQLTVHDNHINLYPSFVVPGKYSYSVGYVDKDYVNHEAYFIINIY